MLSTASPTLYSNLLGVNSECEMTRVPVPEGFHTVVVASDGIWDVAEPQDVAAAVRMGAAGAKDRALEG